jgi:ATP-dependent DNA helicase RecG
MTPERLQQLIEVGESLDVEFKGEERGPLSDNDLVETVVCLANRSADTTAWLLIGVEDDGRITGARPRHESGRTDPVLLVALIANRTRPSLTPRVAVVPLQGKEVIAVEVPPQPVPVATTSGRYLRRALGGDGRPCCLPMFFHEMHAFRADRGAEDYSALLLPDASWDDLDPLEFERFRRFIRESYGRGDTSLVNLPDVELAKALGAVQANHEVSAVRVLGLLLFGREEALRRLLPAHEVAFQVLAGQRVEVNDFFRWPLLRVMEELLVRFRARNREEELMVGLLRVGVPDYSPAAFREEVAFRVLAGQRVEVNDFFRWPLLRVMEELLARFRARNREEELMVGLLRVGVPDYSPAAFREGVANALIHYVRNGDATAL